MDRYPRDLARYVLGRWDDPSQLPPLKPLVKLLSTCYQASLLTEELEAVSFRAALLPPARLATLSGPPRGYHRLSFGTPRPMTPNLMRKLAPALPISQGLLGLQPAGDGFEVWGLIHSGSRGTNQFYSIGRRFEPLPPCLVVTAFGPGALSVSNGHVLVARLSRGELHPPGEEVLSAEWMQRYLSDVRDFHTSVCPEYSAVDHRITQHLVQSMLKRTAQLVRNRGHGATILVVPHGLAEELEVQNPYVTVRYGMLNEEPRWRARTLILKMLQRLTQLHPGRAVGWSDYLASDDQGIAELEGAMEEHSQVVANMASVDGAVIMTHRLEIVGFGVEIAGNLPAVSRIFRATDIEARKTVEESSEGVGTRHRSVYRLCAQLGEVMALVLSQDGRIQLVKQHDNHVVTWDQLSTGIGDF